jgi:hypothetical protein
MMVIRLSALQKKFLVLIYVRGCIDQSTGRILLMKVPLKPKGNNSGAL